MAIILEIGNSYSRVLGLSIDQHRSLRKTLSYTDPNQKYSSGLKFTKINYLIDKSGSFPTGLLSRFDRWAAINKLMILKQDTRKLPKPVYRAFNMSLAITPYRDQTNAVAACLRSNRGIISMPTGSGKSVTMAMLIEKLQLRTLVIVPNLELKRQLSETFNQLFGSLNNVTIENIDSGSLKNCIGYDVLIIDEAHHVAAKTYRNLNRKNWGSIYYRFHFTATPFRSQAEEQILFEAIAGQVVYELSYKDAVAEGYIVPIEAYYIDVPKKVKVEGSYSAVYSSQIVHREDRNKLISEVLTSLKGKSTLCLVKQIEHGENIRSFSPDVHFVKGENEDNAAALAIFNRGGYVMLGTHGVVGEGVDTEPCEWVVVPIPVKSKNLFMQMIGRGVRRFQGKETCKVILFRDHSSKWFLNAFREQVKILKEMYGTLPIKLDL